MRKHIVMLSALVAAFASFAAPFTDGGVTYTPNNEVSRYQPVVTGVNVTGMVESVAYTKGEVDRRIETNAPVRSVNGMRGNVRLGAREVGALPDNRAYLEDDANFVEAVRNVQIKKVTTGGGTARMLPKYLYAMEFSDSYTNDAAWYYDNHHDYGYCSVVRDGDIVSRNYDWRFDGTAEFVVLMSSVEGRFASVGVANCGTNLTDDIVSSGHWSRYFKCLPGRTVDGLNENGVFVCVNVYRDSYMWPTSGTLHCNAAVRWVLDNATSAEQAANYIADNVYIPSEVADQTSFHWMIADSEGTWIVERSHATKITGYSKLPALSNYLVLVDSSSVYFPERYAEVGEGGERLMLLTNGGNITNAWFTNAYSPSTSWLTDFGTNEVVMSEAKRRWGLMPKESHRGESFLGYTWWQSLHTSVYDITNRTLRISVQETDDWYTFAVPSAGGVKPEAVKEIVEPMIAAHHDDTKLDKTGGTITREDGEPVSLIVRPDTADMEVKFGEFSFTGNGAGDGSKFSVGDFKLEAVVGDDGWYGAMKMSVDGDGAAISVNGTNVTDKLSEIEAGVSAKRDLTDNTCRKTDFTEWKFSPPLVDGFIITNEEDGVYLGGWIFVDVNGLRQSLEKGNENSLQVEWSAREWEGGYDITATRTGPVCVSNELFATISFVTNVVTAAKYVPSATDPAFSNAVLAVGIDTNLVSQIGELNEWIGDYGGMGATTLGGLLAALLAAVAALKKSKVGSFASVGGATATVTDGVADVSDFFSESASFTPPTTVAGALKNSILEKSIVLAVTENFADADTTSYGSAT